jgi:hypothetical protein
MFAEPPFNIIPGMLASSLSLVNFRCAELRLCAGGVTFAMTEKLYQGKS